MERHKYIGGSPGGFSLLELLLVLAVLSICLTVASGALVETLHREEARGAGQVWQTAAGWAQLVALWQHSGGEVTYGSGGLRLSRDDGQPVGQAGEWAVVAPVSTNLARWRLADGVSVSFGGAFASPDGGGSIYFASSGGTYRVAVRPESGLTVRSLVEAVP